jgi:hypothetical protein
MKVMPADRFEQLLLEPHRATTPRCAGFSIQMAALRPCGRRPMSVRQRCGRPSAIQTPEQGNRGRRGGVIADERVTASNELTQTWDEGLATV